MPEIQDGKNVADFIDADIIAKLEELEAEEDRLEAAGFYDDEDDVSKTILISDSNFEANSPLVCSSILMKMLLELLRLPSEIKRLIFD